MSFPSQSPTLSSSGHWRCYGNWNTKCHCRHWRLGHGDFFSNSSVTSICCLLNAEACVATAIMRWPGWYTQRRFYVSIQWLGKWNLILLTRTRRAQISAKANPVPIRSPYPESGSKLWSSKVNGNFFVQRYTCIWIRFHSSSEIQAVLTNLFDNRWKHSYSCGISVSSALHVYTSMRYINSYFKLYYIAHCTIPLTNFLFPDIWAKL